MRTRADLIPARAGGGAVWVRAFRGRELRAPRGRAPSPEPTSPAVRSDVTHRHPQPKSGPGVSRHVVRHSSFVCASVCTPSRRPTRGCVNVVVVPRPPAKRRRRTRTPPPPLHPHCAHVVAVMSSVCASVWAPSRRPTRGRVSVVVLSRHTTAFLPSIRVRHRPATATAPHLRMRRCH